MLSEMGLGIWNTDAIVVPEAELSNLGDRRQRQRLLQSAQIQQPRASAAKWDLAKEAEGV